MVNINDVKVLVYNLAAKQQEAFPSPDEFNSYANLANIDLFNYYNDERNKMLLDVKTGMNLYVPAALIPFVVNNAPLAHTASSGVLTLPDDFLYDLAVKTPINGINSTIKEVDYDKVETYLNSTIDNPTAANPIYVELDTVLNVYPINTNPVLMTYIKQPIKVLWAYTLVNNRPVYNSGTSINFEFPQTEYLRLSSRILGYMGLSIRDMELEQAATQITQSAS